MKSQFNIFFLFRHIWCRHRVKDVADRLVLGATVESLKSNMLLAPVVMWMEQAGVIEHGHLASNFVTLTTSLSKPTCCPSCDSRLGIKHSLEQDGWRKVETVREASVVDKCFSHVGPLEYFQLLKHHAGRLLEYEEMFPFRHSQGKGYYDCFLVFFQNRPAEACNQSFGLWVKALSSFERRFEWRSLNEDLLQVPNDVSSQECQPGQYQFIPMSQKLEFYKSLMDFFQAWAWALYDMRIQKPFTPRSPPINLDDFQSLSPQLLML